MRRHDFTRQKAEAPRYPSANIFLTRYGTVSGQTYWQGLDAPFMVELFIVRTFHANRRTCLVRLSASRRTNSPRQPTLNEPHESCTRMVLADFGPNPAVGIFTRLIATARPAASLSRSPGFEMLYGIESADYSRNEDCSQKPPSNRRSHSHGESGSTGL